MGHSKWNYLAAGVAVMGAFVGALVHSAFCLIINLLFVIWNWNVAEAKRVEEEKALIEDSHTSEENKPNE